MTYERFIKMCKAIHSFVDFFPPKNDFREELDSHIRKIEKTIFGEAGDPNKVPIYFRELPRQSNHLAVQLEKWIEDKVPFLKND